MKWLTLLFFFLTTSIQAEKNSLIVSRSSQETLEWMHDLIVEAKESIILATFTTGGEVLVDLLKAMESRLQQCPELEVHIIAAPHLIFEKESAVIDRLKEEYPRFHFQVADSHFRALPDYNINENHFKCFVVDERYYIIGGTNLHDAFCCEGTTSKVTEKTTEIFSSTLPSGTRDMDLVGRGPLGADLTKIFHEVYGLWEYFGETTYFLEDPGLFQGRTYKKVTGTTSIQKFDQHPKRVEVENVKCILGGPHQENNAITQEYKKLIDEAQGEISLANLYFNPTPPLFERMKEAVKRGVSFSLITNGAWEGVTIYAALFAWGNRVNYAPLYLGKEYHFWERPEQTFSNVDIHEFQVDDVLYHKKVMVIDKKHTIIGSYNLNPKSDFSDFELVLVVDSEQIAKDILSVLEIDRKYSKKVSMEEALDWYFDPQVAYKGAFQKLFQGFL